MRFQIKSRMILLPRMLKRALVGASDIFSCIAATAFAIWLRLESFILPSGLSIWFPAFISILISIPLFSRMGLYREVFRFSSLYTFSRVFRAVAIFAGFYVFVFTVIGVNGYPRSIGVIQPIFLLLLITISRWLIRQWFLEETAVVPANDRRSRVVIYGAGLAARGLVRSIQGRKWIVVAFLDTDSRLWGSTIQGVTVYSPEVIRKIVIEESVDELWLAQSKDFRHLRISVIDSLQDLCVRVRTLRDVGVDTGENPTIADIQDLQVADLLGRPSREHTWESSSEIISGKTVLITGAGGSIGSEISRLIIQFCPSRIILCDHNEYGLYEIHRQLKESLRLRSLENAAVIEVGLVPILASVTDQQMMHDIFLQYRPSAVFHAAAYKHVTMLQSNVNAALWNNVLGTYICAKESFASDVEVFILVSTDKAVRPTNVMGVSKRLAELVVQAIAFEARDQGQVFSVVRFGNVLDSSGSVVPIFREQIVAGGPVTVTHPDVTRYFMTIPEAACLVLEASQLASGGEVFVLDMGDAVRIYDLARRMIQLSGHSVRDDNNSSGDIEIRFTGLQPGEKLFEELLIGANPEVTPHPKIMKAREDYLPLDELEKELEKLFILIRKNDLLQVKSTIARLVPEYTPDNSERYQMEHV
jgi:FlaA1/EpsC-like NDP-sugar epimerase